MDNRPLTISPTMPPDPTTALPALPLRACSIDASPRRDLLALLLGIVAFAALSTWCSVKSLGFLEADAMTHFLFARYSFRQWGYLFDVWGRPLCTGAYAIPANLFDDVRSSVLAVRATSLLLAVLTGLVVWRIARGQKYRYPALAAILLFAQPLFFAHSFSELTEIPFGLVAALALWAYQRRKFLAMALLATLTLMGRPEGFLLMLLGAFALVLHRRWYWLGVMPLPLLAWSFMGWLSTGGWWEAGNPPWYLWLKTRWPYAAQSPYGKGPWNHYLILLPVIVGPMMLPFLFVGWADAFRRGLGWVVRAIFGEPSPAPAAVAPPAAESAPAGTVPYAGRDVRTGKRPPDPAAHRARCDLVAAAIPLAILVVHSILWARGMVGSSGEPRYLVCAAPFWALVVARGWEWVWGRFRLPVPAIVAGLFSLSAVVANRMWQVFPLQIYDNDRMGEYAAKWYRTTPGLEQDYPRLMATPPAIYFFTDISQSDKQRGLTWGRGNVRAHPPGTILFWDSIYGLYNPSPELMVPKEEVEANGWIWIGNLGYGGAWCDVYLSPKSADGKATEPYKYRAPGDLTPQ